MAFFNQKRGKIDPKIDFKKKSEIPFFLTMEGSIYSNFQVSNPKNEIRRIFGQKMAFFGHKRAKINPKIDFKKNQKYEFF